MLNFFPGRRLTRGGRFSREGFFQFWKRPKTNHLQFEPFLFFDELLPLFIERPKLHGSRLALRGLGQIE